MLLLTAGLVFLILQARQAFFFPKASLGSSITHARQALGLRSRKHGKPWVSSQTRQAMGLQSHKHDKPWAFDHKSRKPWVIIRARQPRISHQKACKHDGSMYDFVDFHLVVSNPDMSLSHQWSHLGNKANHLSISTSRQVWALSFILSGPCTPCALKQMCCVRPASVLGAEYL